MAKKTTKKTARRKKAAPPKALNISKKKKAESLRLRPRESTLDVYGPVIEAVEQNLKSAGDAIEVAIPEGREPESFRNCVGAAIRRRLTSMTGKVRLRRTLDDKSIAIIRK